MKNSRSILVLIAPKSEASEQERLLRNAKYLGDRLGFSIHVFAPNIAKLGKVPLPGEAHIVFHPLSRQVVNQLLDGIEEYGSDLVLMAKESDAGRIRKTSMERQILEELPCPILLVPPEMDLESEPIRSLLVPLSGEERISESLGFALRLAEQLKAPVDLVHVTAPDRPCLCMQTLELVGDEFQHEYPELMERVISEASPFSNPRQRSRARWFHHASGRTTDEIRKILEAERGAVLVIEWKGILERGHARVVKEIVHEKRYPILFVKMGRLRKSTLKVGPRFEAA